MFTGVTQFYKFDEENFLDTSLFDQEHKLYLSFNLEHDSYGISIDSIIEVKSLTDLKIRKLVKAPKFLSGVFNLRGNIVPLIDLRVRWNSQNVEFTDKTAVIVLNIDKKMWAITVDKINEVCGIKKEEIIKAPTMSYKLDVRYFLGITNRQGVSLLLLDIDRLMNSDEMGLIESMSKE